MLNDDVRRHVFRDLRACIYPFTPCDTPERIYRDFQEWEDHLAIAHAQQKQIYLDKWAKPSWKSDPRPKDFEDVNLDDILNKTLPSDKRESYELEDICPICCENLFPCYMAGIDSRERHMARHMEKAALCVDMDISLSVKRPAGSDSSQGNDPSIAGWSSEESDCASNDSNEGDDSGGRIGNEAEAVHGRNLEFDMKPLMHGNDNTLAVFQKRKKRKLSDSIDDRAARRFRKSIPGFYGGSNDSMGSLPGMDSPWMHPNDSMGSFPRPGSPWMHRNNSTGSLPGLSPWRPFDQDSNVGNNGYFLPTGDDK